MTAARHLHVVPSEAELLAADIRNICQQIDRRLGNRPGTAARGTYFWLWPPDPLPDVSVLTRLHADAVKFLHTLITTIETRKP